MLDLGIEPYVLASSLNLIVAQRLVRRVCETCSDPVEPPADVLAMLKLPASDKFRRGQGCPTCRQSGFTGRVGVYEVMPITPTVGKLIEANAGEIAIRTAARNEGCTNVQDDAIAKLLAGVTTTEEVLRVVQIGETAAPRCPACQKTIAEDYAVCPHCSTVLRATCTGCKKQLSPEWITCPYCGKAQRAAQPQPPPRIEPAAAPARPASSAPPSRTAAPEPAAPAPVPPVAPARYPRTFKALVVDDQADLRHIVRVALETANLGLTVITAQDGAEALAFADLERPDVVILDVSMPGMDGFEVCRRLRADGRTAFVPILMLTAHNTADFVAQGFGVGADDYVAKPFRRQDLVARVRRMLERTYGPEAVPAHEATAAPGVTGIVPGSGTVERLH
jgi:CheY-like chemotaxis protein